MSFGTHSGWSDPTETGSNVNPGREEFLDAILTFGKDTTCEKRPSHAPDSVPRSFSASAVIQDT